MEKIPTGENPAYEGIIIYGPCCATFNTLLTPTLSQTKWRKQLDSWTNQLHWASVARSQSYLFVENCVSVRSSDQGQNDLITGWGKIWVFQNIYAKLRQILANWAKLRQKRSNLGKLRWWGKILVEGQQVLSVLRSKVVLIMFRKGFLKIFFYKYLSSWC